MHDVSRRIYFMHRMLGTLAHVGDATHAYILWFVGMEMHGHLGLHVVTHNRGFSFYNSSTFIFQSV